MLSLHSALTCATVDDGAESLGGGGGGGSIVLSCTSLTGVTAQGIVDLGWVEGGKAAYCGAPGAVVVGTPTRTDVMLAAVPQSCNRSSIPATELKWEASVVTQPPHVTLSPGSSGHIRDDTDTVTGTLTLASLNLQPNSTLAVADELEDLHVTGDLPVVNVSLDSRLTFGLERVVNISCGRDVEIAVSAPPHPYHRLHCCH